MRRALAVAHHQQRQLAQHPLERRLERLRPPVGPSEITGIAARPVAASISVSEVEVSPSTVMQLKVRAFARASIACSRLRSTAASVKTNASIVAMSGAIMPEPLAKPAIRTGTPSSSTVVAATLAKVSVVMIARAAAAAASAASPSRSAPITATIRSAGSGSPITPVEATKTWPAGMPSAVAVASTVARTAARPAPPVKALALPALARMAKPACAGRSSAASRSWHQITGAARVADRVKTPASVDPAATSASITSGRPV